MEQFQAIILKYAKKGEKTGWSYIEIPGFVAQKIYPGNKKSFRVKGKIDTVTIEKTALLPIGDGNFILPINASLRKKTGKSQGAMLNVSLEIDNTSLEIDTDFMECLADEKEGKKFFSSLPKSHQNYFSKWIQSAKTETTKAKRIAQAIGALSKKQGFPEMIRANKNNNL